MPTQKKHIETHYLRRFQALCPDFPEGTLAPSEEPDFLVSSTSTIVGIELTELHREVSAGNVPPQASEAMRHRVTARAQELYSLTGHPPIRCTVFMNNGHIKKDQVHRLASALVDIAIRNLPGSNSSTQESYDWNNRSYFPEEFDTVSIHRLDEITENFFSCPGATWVATLSPSDIERALASKEDKYATYRKQCDMAWLLINADTSSMSTWFELDLAAIPGPFKSSFDRAFVLHHFGSKLLELALTP